MNKYDFIREMVPKCGVQWEVETLRRELGIEVQA